MTPIFFRRAQHIYIEKNADCSIEIPNTVKYIDTTKTNDGSSFMTIYNIKRKAGFSLDNI